MRFQVVVSLFVLLSCGGGASADCPEARDHYLAVVRRYESTWAGTCNALRAATDWRIAVRSFGDWAMLKASRETRRSSFAGAQWKRRRFLALA